MKNSKPKREDLTLGERLPFAVVGIIIIVYGYGQILRGKPLYTNWQGQNLSAQFVIFLGALFLLVAIFPSGRIKFLWDTGKKKHRR
jgi:hypothetical protein